MEEHIFRGLEKQLKSKSENGRELEGEPSHTTGRETGARHMIKHIKQPVAFKKIILAVLVGYKMVDKHEKFSFPL